MENESRTELQSMGEFALINHLVQYFIPKQKSTIKDAGDDAAVIDPPTGERLVMTTDLLVEGVHFDLMYSPLKHLGYKAVVVNISDICAMNAKPTQFTVSLAVSNKYSVEALEELYSGMLSACDFSGIDLVGCYTTPIAPGFAISITAIGFALPEKISLRSGAKVNDLLVVTGDLGGAYLGLQILEREKQVFLAAPGAQPQLEGYDYVISRQLKPEARVDIIELLDKLEVKPTAMIDISDGLSSEIIHLAEQSNCAFRIFEDKIPVSPEAQVCSKELNLDPTTAALNGGEDYELLFTIKMEDYDKIKGNPNFSVIGHATSKEERNILETIGGGSVELKAQGWTL
ncbi:MAG: thiamine-phosphate kinase [Bacteroidota bacterium]